MLDFKKIKLYKRILNFKKVNDLKDIDNIYIKKYYEKIINRHKLVIGKTAEGCTNKNIKNGLYVQIGTTAEGCISKLYKIN